MRKKILYSFTVLAIVMSSTSWAQAEDIMPKRALKSNYQEVYNQSLKHVDKFSEMFLDGNFYGRLRSNTFLFNWEKENNEQRDHLASGLGGSLIYQSAIYNDFDIKLGLYYSHGFIDDASLATVNNLKAGADVLNRAEYRSNGSQDLTALGQSYVRYSGIPKSDVMVGRQLVETFYTTSNDTKMIPNTFDGVVFNTSALSKTKIAIAYLTDEKMRGHENTNSPLVYSSDTTSDSFNDDSAMHKGLTQTALIAHGKPTDAPLIVVDFHNSFVDNLKIDASYYNVPELLSQGMIEGNYKVALNKDFSINPGVRYIKQFDDGAGSVGGAALNGKLAGHSGNYGGYKDANSLDSQMLAARVVAKYKNYQLNLAYSKVFDEADLVTPWRGFPTAGYTRSMARYNWVANTKSYRAELSVNANKSGIYKDIFMQLSALHTDADEKKGQYDENYYYVGFVQNLPSMPELQWRFRVGHQDTKQQDADTIDTRFELNYLF